MTGWRGWLPAIVAMASLAASAAPPQGQQGVTLHLNPDAIRQQMATSHAELVDVNNQSTINKYLQAFSQTTQLDDQQQIVSELTDYCVERGLRPSPDVAELFLSMALEAKAQGRTDDFVRLCQYAEGFDPGHPAVHLAAAAAVRQQSGIFSGQYLYEVLAAAFSSFRSPETRWVAFSNLALWLRVTSFLVLGLLSLLLLVKYQGQLRHDVREWLGGGESGLVTLAGFTVLFLPSLILLAGYWWIIYWAGLFLLYAKWPERAAVLAASALLLASGTFSLYCQQRLFLSQSPPHVSNIRCYANRIGVGPDAYLSSHATPGDPLFNVYGLLLANRYLLHGSYLKAENTYQLLLSSDPGNASVSNNLGCIYFYENRYQEAIQQFGRAIQVRPTMASAYLNRSLAENKLFDFSGAKDDQEKARNLSPHLFDAFNSAQNEEWGPLPSWVPRETTLDMARRMEAQKASALKGPLRIGSSWLGLLFAPPFSLWLVVFVAAGLAAVLTRKAGFFARACLKCGRPFCGRCKTSLEFESFCSQCVHLYIKQDGVSPEARLKKNYEVEHYNESQRIQRAVFSVVAPGAGHFMEGRPFSALFLMLLWCGLLSGLFLGSYAFPMPFPTTVTAGALEAVYGIVAVALLVLLWVLFGLPTALRRQPPQLNRLLKG